MAVADHGGTGDRGLPVGDDRIVDVGDLPAGADLLPE